MPQPILALALVALFVTTAFATNPILPGHYADPDAVVFDKTYWIYPTYSAPYDEQTHLDAFSSPDLVTWTRHPRILSTDTVKWAKRAIWAPSAIRKDGKYYLFFAANDIQSNKELGGIGVAVADKPDGPFTDLLGKPLIGQFHNGAQPIDQFVFQDPKDKHWYILYGGWRHCNLARLSPDFRSIVPLDDKGTLFKELTPEGYVEGPCILVRNDTYYFMWSEGGWTGPDYRVAYATAPSLFGPYTKQGTILKQDPSIATGAGHHSVLSLPDSDTHYIVYHRRPLDTANPHHRVTCIDELRFSDDGRILPVKMTTTAVGARPLK